MEVVDNQPLVELFINTEGDGIHLVVTTVTEVVSVMVTATLNRELVEGMRDALTAFLNQGE